MVRRIISSLLVMVILLNIAQPIKAVNNNEGDESEASKSSVLNISIANGIEITNTQIKVEIESADEGIENEQKYIDVDTEIAREYEIDSGVENVSRWVLSWVVNDEEELIGEYESDGSDIQSIEIESGPSIGGCKCTLEIPDIENLEMNIGVLTGTTIDLRELRIEGNYNSNNCSEHNDGEVKVEVEYSLNGTISGGVVDLDGDILDITNIEGLEVIIPVKVSASYNGLNVEKEFSIRVIRELEMPIIKEYEYNSADQQIRLLVSPNGHKSARVYIDGVYKDIEFEKDGLDYLDAEVLFDYSDTQAPKAVSNITVNRDGSDAKISWDDGEDIENSIEIYVEVDDEKSDIVNLNIADNVDTIRYKIDVYNSIGEAESYEVVGEKSINIPIIDIEWDSSIAITVIDTGLNESGIKTLLVPNSVIYDTVVVDDTISINEGGSGLIDVEENDTHDSLYSKPKLLSVEILDGGVGKVELVESNGNSSDFEWTRVSYISEDGYYGNVVVRYTYEKVREDIPAASGLIYISVEQRNQEPVANNDGLDVTKNIKCEDGVTITIPSELLLANDSDRETPTLISIVEVGNCSAGNIKLINGDIELTPTIGYGGELTFRYKISDGESESNWATVTILVTKVEKTPVASDVNYSMSLTAKSLVINLNVSNSSSQAWNIDSNLVAYKNGEALASNIIGLAIKYNSRDGADPVPYIELSLKDDTYFVVDDIITIPYTVKSSLTGGSSSAVVHIKMTKGDDPNDMEGYLYVHRKPIASFSPIIHRDSSKYVTGVTIGSSNEYSYDLDHEQSHAIGISSRPSYSIKGIRTWEWGVKLLDGNWEMMQFDADTYGGSAESARSAGITWVNSKANSIISANPQRAVMISLRVRDVDGEGNMGVWSAEKTVLLSSIAMPPVAMFTLDKSTYTVGNNIIDFSLRVTDMSYDANGDNIINWKWTLETPSGVSSSMNGMSLGSFSTDSFSYTLKQIIFNYINTGSYNPEDPTFKLTLVVTDDSVDKLESDEYSVSFKVYKQNYPPDISTNPGGDASSIQSSTLYQVDDGVDGTVGDNWGTIGNITHKGTINFSSLFSITDDQDLSGIRINWLFEGQKVIKRSNYNDNISASVNKSYSNLTYSPFKAPFTNTVTDQGFSPGAYKLTVTVTDNPNGNGYPSNSSQMSSWRTYSDKAPYHFYVVPKLDMFMHNEVNGWIDQSYKEDGTTLEESGLSLEDIVPTIGDTIRLYGTTNQYVDKLWGYEDKNNNGIYDSGEKKILFTRVATNLDGTREWESEFTIEDIDDAPEGSEFTILNIKLVGETTWGSESGVTMRTKQKAMPIKVLPVKLYDFRVTKVTDPDISSKFNGYIKTLQLQGIKLTNGLVVDGVPVGKLAIDRNSIDGSVMSKGYSFYFSVSSKGLTKDTDEVRIYPRFYESKVNAMGVVSIGNELVGYVPDSSGVYQPYTTRDASEEIERMYELYYEGSRINSLNSHAEVIIPTDLREINGSEQVWYGRYGIPTDAKFFRSGVVINKLNEYTGDILVTFEIVAYKKGEPRYNYVERGQWLKERSIVSDSLKAVYKAKEADWKAQNNYIGTVIAYNGSSSIKDDYISNPVWNE